ncbi:MAG: SGNH/GDSL hydrolase family protein [Nitrospinota bacterium]
MTKQIFFRIASVCLAVFFALIGAEGALRIGGYNYRNVVGDYEEGVGWRYLPNQKVTTKAFYGIPTTVTINSLGFRGGEIGPKDKGRSRILLLGDSFTLGYGVSDGETVPFYLESLLTKSGRGVEVINGGIGGTTIIQQKRLYEKYGETLEPDEVILLFCLNDLKDIRNFDNEASLQKRHSEFVRAFKRIFYNTAIGDLVMRARLGWISRREAFMNTPSPAYAVSSSAYAASERAYAKKPDKNLFDIYLKEFLELAEKTAATNRPLTFVVLPLGPHPDDYTIAGWSIKKFTEEISARLSAQTEGVGVKVFALYEKFGEEIRKDLSYPDWHYKPEGNRVIAEILRDYIVEKRSVKTNY